MDILGTLRGDGLARAHRALMALEDPERLALVRERFSESPPSYRSHQSHNSTLSQSPNPPCIEQQQRDEVRFRLMNERRASLPYYQFQAQTQEERDRIIQADIDGTDRAPIGVLFDDLARERVKKQWVEQGIWNEKWNAIVHGWLGAMNDGRWKHEEPLVIDSESDSESKIADHSSVFPSLFNPQCPKPMLSGAESEAQKDTEPRSMFFSWTTSKPRPRPADVGAESDTQGKSISRGMFSSGPEYPPPQSSRPQENRNSNEKKQSIAERQATLEREREASRPFYQFIYQVSRERDQIQRATDRAAVTPTSTLPADINTKAYENAMRTWIRRKIWNRKWGILPGMTWKHEEPLELLTADLPPAQVNPPQPVNDGHDAGESPRPRIFSPVPPGKTDDRQTPGVASPPPRRGQSPLNSVDLTNRAAEPSLQSNTAPRRRGRPPILRGQIAQSRSEIPLGLDTQPPPVDRSTLGPVHPSRITKSSAKKRPTPQRKPNQPDELSAAGLSSAPGPDATQTPRRRSKRLQKHESSAADNPGERASKNPLDGVSQSRPTRASVSKPKTALSAKSQGVSKQKQTRTTRNRQPKKAK
ncbi:hypothetical protein GX50_07714 [[Emmonsia] crescens]|uniref:Uncharacterized protein n=1 Tax=[Emmonsia] crescens TaxID=73230 RepID=A0A2B7YZL0_9EURO|nr:hypothetical protein GX50_07714 [Emmonsia crescens]